ncbi:hypothetical protein BS50DRAFT_607763 [Corynespora cassiicola Philippines]|uniref:DUF1996 domain-containing protein n=1 Tax=Corynespora cassiicola Philippines TaxID=1448308 RepID=A0A2T2P477_CORCC|nr:hypothetical protein BS50DRAFT_607763 [Corynespora cassiicola Philippines]
MQWLSFAALALVAPASAELWQSCATLVIDRIDPLLNPGQVPSQYLRQVVGGDSFNATMPIDKDVPRKTTCTTCLYSEDFSNYYTPVLYFKARNGKYKRVPTFPNDDEDASLNGIIVEYNDHLNKQTSVTAFKNGFRMMVGGPTRRENTGDDEARSLNFRCFQYQVGGITGPGEDTNHFPAKPCPGGIRASHYFPTCWDGTSLDSPDHRSHVIYPYDGNFDTLGPCPSSHPVKVPQLVYHVGWDTTEFNNPNDWPDDGSQPFVFSTGDPTGYGSHAEYVFGWKGDALQRAMDAKCMDFCGVISDQYIEDANNCHIPPVVHDDIDSWVSELPGGVKVTH